MANQVVTSVRDVDVDVDGGGNGEHGVDDGDDDGSGRVEAGGLLPTGQSEQVNSPPPANITSHWNTAAMRMYLRYWDTGM